MGAPHIPLLGFILSMATSCLGELDTPEATEPTWRDDVVPIVENSCLPCHRAGGSNGITLDSRDTFLLHGDAVMAALEDQIMPPGSVDRSGDCGEYRGYKPISDASIDVIARFLETAHVNTTATPNEDATRAVSTFVQPQGTPQAHLLPHYAPAATGDDHRCFVLFTSPTAGSVLTGMNIERERNSSLHHLMLFSLPAPSSIEHALALDSEEKEAGFPCEGHPQVAGTELLSVWTPGQGTIALPEDTGVATGGSAILVQAHFHVEEGPEKHGGRREEVLSVVLYTTHEVPMLIRPVPIAASGFTLPPDEERVEFTLTRPAPFSGPVLVHGVFPHMHTLGSSIRLSIGDEEEMEDSEACLAQSTRWRFDWQDTAFFETPKTLAPTTTLSLQCVWDTRGRNEAIRWGEGSLDEMCTLFLFVSPAEGGA